MDSNAIISALNWRYAVQIFDLTKSLKSEDLHTILESGRLAPSSFGVEPWKFIVVQNAAVRARLREVSFGQPKVTDAAAIVVVAYRTDAAENISRERVERTAKIQHQKLEELAGLRQMLNTSIASRVSAGTLEAWIKAQAYIPLGIMVETAALLGIDSGPMEGFSADQVDAILGLKEKNLHATSMLALGYRGDDPAAKRPKVRREFDEVVEFVR